MPNWVSPCAACLRNHRAIGGDGPRPAPVLAIMERPGFDENRQGRVACGKTGQELDELYLPLAGLDRSEIRVCNTVLCWADNNKTPSDKEVAQCAPHHLPEEIKLTNPEVILLLGSTACKLCPGVKLDMMHGIPQPTSKVGSVFGWHGWVIPLHHPAIGLHESRWMKICIDDWEGLESILSNDFEEDPPVERTSYSVWTPRHAWIHSEHPMGIDTESHGGRPWSVQVSAMPRSGVLYPTSESAAMDHLRSMLLASDEVVLHNAAYDLEVLRKLGIHIKSYRDTMQEAFHLGNLPQGLKALTYRLFRHTMTSYEETVTPASIRALQEWMLEAHAIAQADLSYITKRRHKTSGKALKDKVEGSELESLLTRLLRLTQVGSDYNPWGSDKEPRLDAFWHTPENEWMVTHVEARVGHYPILGIANCSMSEAVRYAVGDADWCGRVAVELALRRQDAFQILDGDRDI